MNINSLPKHYRSRLLRETNCIHKDPIPSKNLASSTRSAAAKW